MDARGTKRQRVDAANATLKKPFHSPVIKRPDNPQAGQHLDTPGPSRSLIDAAGTNIAQDVGHSPRSPSVPARPRPTTIRIRPANSLFAVQQTPHRLSTPLFRTLQPSPACDRPIARIYQRQKSTAGIPALDQEGTDRPGGAFRALVRAHRHTVQDAAVRHLNKELETVRQARLIEAVSERTRPDKFIDQELRVLVVRWKTTSRTAAEELFESVKERVDNAGGPAAWGKMREQQLAFYQGFYQESLRKKEDFKDENIEEEIEGTCGAEMGKYALQHESAGGNSNEEEGRELEFTMAQMLQTLNIDLCLLGYSESQERWVD